jgi:hypothetical protein
MNMRNSEIHKIKQPSKKLIVNAQTTAHSSGTHSRNKSQNNTQRRINNYTIDLRKKDDIIEAHELTHTQTLTNKVNQKISFLPQKT